MHYLASRFILSNPEAIMDPLTRLHDRTPSGAVVLYPPKPGRAKEAARFWKRTGVCPSCHRRAITVARCLLCGWKADK